MEGIEQVEVLTALVAVVILVTGGVLWWLEGWKVYERAIPLF